MYAHSLQGRPTEMWEPLSEHLAAVSNRAGCFAEIFGWADAARAAGLLHDVGKASVAFQAYIAQPRAETGGPKGPDHSTAGAREAVAAFPGLLGRMLACIIAGHHAGLDDADGLDRRLSQDRFIEPYAAWRSQAGLVTAGPVPASTWMGAGTASWLCPGISDADAVLLSGRCRFS